MQYDVGTPDEYLRALDPDWRRDTLMALRQVIERTAPELRESIRYGMLSYEDDRGAVFALNAQTGYVSLYSGDAKRIDPTGEFVGDLDCGKSCILFRKSVRVEETRVEDLISRAAVLRRNGGNTGC